MPKKITKTMNQAAIEALDKLNAMTPEELQKAIDETPEHELTRMLEDCGYFADLEKAILEKK